MKAITAARNPEYIAAALGVAQAIGFAYASIVAEGNGSAVTWLMALVRGAFLGYALAFGLVMTAHQVPRIQAKRARLIGWVALVGLLVISPVIIAPAIQHSIPVSVLSSAWARWIWAASIAAAPDLVAIGIAVTGKLAAVTQPETTTATAPQPKQPKPQPVKPTLSDVALLEELKRNPGATQAQLGTTFGVSAAAIGKRLRKMKGTV